jgi:amino acid adenylation domain-containing protein
MHRMAESTTARLNQERIVVVLMEKGWRQVVASLAILRGHGAYLPMDPKIPPQRQQHIIEASGALFVITDAAGLKNAPWLTGRPDLLVECDVALQSDDEKHFDDLGASSGSVNPGSLAYLIYTSGSTGLPKGVRCHHQGAMNTIEDLNSEFSVGPTDRVLALSSLSFDLSVYDIFGMFAAGAAVVIPSPDVVSPPDPQKWLELVRDEQISVWNTVPRFMELLVSHVEQSGEKIPSSLRLVFMSGDFIPLTLPGRIRDACENASIRIVSMGGATEAAVWSNIHEIQSGDTDASWSSIPYGRPMRNQRMYVLDAEMEHCATWVTGAIYIGGVGVALGYHGDESRTAHQFVTHPRTGEYLFRTGDLGRVRPHGASRARLLEILGREDSQVKVGGFRVELGEIERVLEGHPGVASAVAAVQDGHLVAFVIPKAASEVDLGGGPEKDDHAGLSVALAGPAASLVVARATDGEARAAQVRSARPLDPSPREELPQLSLPEDLESRCASHLPPYMVPRLLATLAAFPLSPNGKIDRSKLPHLDRAAFVTGRRFGGGGGEDGDVGDVGGGTLPPLTASESARVLSVRRLEAEVLRVPLESVGAHASFFALGGDSLSALLLLRKVSKRASSLLLEHKKKEL